MAILNIHLNLRQDYKDLLNDLIKIIIILLTFHALLSLSQGKSPTANLGLTGDLFNNDFLTVFVFLIISFYIYHMIFKRVIEIV